MNMKKIEKKLTKLEEQKSKNSTAKLDKKIMKLEKKKAKLEKWLKIKLPFRILIKGVIAWLIIGGVCYACNYIPVIKEMKIAFTGAIAYVAPEPVSKVLDVVTLNPGVSNNDFEWLKSTINSYINGDIKIETNHNQYVAENTEKLDSMVQEVLGTTSINEISSMSISEILMKIATNSTSEIVSELLDIANLTTESRQRVEQDINRALKIIQKLNNNQMNELVDFITNKFQDINKQSQDTVNQFNAAMELEQQRMK